MQHLYFPTLTTLDLPSIGTPLGAAFYPHFVYPPALIASTSNVLSLSSPSVAASSSPSSSMPFFSTLSPQLNNNRQFSSPYMTPSSMPSSSLPSIPPLDISAATLAPSTSTSTTPLRMYDHQWYRTQYVEGVSNVSSGGRSTNIIPDPSIELRLEFLKMWTSILAGYRHFAVYLPDNQRNAKRTNSTTPNNVGNSRGGISASSSFTSGLTTDLINNSNRARSQSHDSIEVLSLLSDQQASPSSLVATAAAASELASAGGIGGDDRSEPTMVFDSPSFVLAKAATGALRTSSFVAALVKTSYFPIFLYERTVPR
jgi:hypothetical protein